jgi:transcriptional regulator with XRE-family HTH domain
MARPPKAKRGQRPKQGAHLLSLRQKAGLTQIELAKTIGVDQTTITLWEWSDSPPRSKDLPTLAHALGVRVEELIYRKDAPPSKQAQPVGEMQRLFEAVKKLPRRQQKKILETVEALVEQYNRKSA